MNKLNYVPLSFKVMSDEDIAKFTLMRFQSTPFTSIEERDEYIYNMILSVCDAKNQKVRDSVISSLQDLGARIYDKNKDIKWHYNQGLEDMATALVPDLVIETEV